MEVVWLLFKKDLATEGDIVQKAYGSIRISSPQRITVTASMNSCGIVIPDQHVITEAYVRFPDKKFFQCAVVLTHMCAAGVCFL